VSVYDDELSWLPVSFRAHVNTIIVNLWFLLLQQTSQTCCINGWRVATPWLAGQFYSRCFQRKAEKSSSSRDFQYHECRMQGDWEIVGTSAGCVMPWDRKHCQHSVGVSYCSSLYCSIVHACFYTWVWTWLYSMLSACNPSHHASVFTPLYVLCP